MATPSNGDDSSGMEPKSGRLLSRAECVILAGMLLCIASLFLVWPVATAGKLLAPAMVVNLTRAGAPDEVRWPVIAGALVAGSLLAFAPPTGSRVPLAFVQALCGLVCFITSLTHFALLPGPLVELLGGGLLTFGAVDRITSGGGR